MIETLFQDTPTVVLFGILAGVLSVFAYIPYIKDTLAGRTQPQRASWLIWSVLSTIALVSQIHEGAGPSLLFAGVQVSCTVLIFALSSWVGTNNKLRHTDHLIFMAAGLGLVLWYFTNSAAYALAVTISISLLGGAATVLKTYRDPGSETCVTWLISFVASGFALLAVGQLDPMLLAYPMYLLVLYGAILGALGLGRLRERRRHHKGLARGDWSDVPLGQAQMGAVWSDGMGGDLSLQAANKPTPIDHSGTLHHAAANASMIGTKSAPFREAPPTSPPSTSGRPKISAALPGLTDPP